jgi:hypothetical protein
MRRARSLTAALALTALLTGGCAAGGPSASTPHQHTGGMNMSAEDMRNMDSSSSTGPSETATMVCGREVRGAVRRTLGLDALPPRPSSSWSGSQRLLACTYRVPHGTLRMSVQDATDAAAGRAFYRQLRSGLAGARALGGMQSFGLHAFQAADGHVVFLKDGKTLHVDTSGLAATALPSGFSRVDVAYGLASAVVACWSE